MDPKRTIYSKTGKGSRALSAKSKELSAQALKVLAAVDSKSDADAIYSRLDRISDTDFRIALAQLENGGYIRALQKSSWDTEEHQSDYSSSIVVEEVSADDFFGTSPKPDTEIEAAESAARKAEEEEGTRREAESQAKREAESKARAEEAAKNEKARLARAEQERLAKESLRKEEEEVRKEKARQERKIREEAENRRKADEEAKRIAEQNARAEAERKLRETEAARLQAEQTAREEAERKALEAAEARRLAEQRAQQEAEARARAERKAMEAEQARQKAEEEAARKEAERLAREEQERQAREAEQAQLKAEQKAREAAERQAKEAAAQRQAEEEERRREEAAAREEAERLARVEWERKAREAEEVRLKAEQEARAVAERKALEEAEARRLAEEQAQREAEARAEAERKVQAAEAARQRAEEAAKLEAERRAREEEEARRAAEEKAARETEETRLRAEEAARLEEERSRREEENRKSREAEEIRLKTEQEARAAAELKAREEADARKLAEEQARREAEARAEAEQKARKAEEARLKAEAMAEKARLKAESNESRRLAKEEARAQAEAAAQEKADRKARVQAERRARKMAALRGKREPGETRGRAGTILKGVVAALALAAVITIIAVQFFNLSFLAAPIEKIASASMGEPIRILGNVRLSFSPAPHLNLSDVLIGKNEDVKFASVTIAPAVATLFAETPIVDMVSFSDATINANQLDRPRAWFRSAAHAGKFKLTHLAFKSVSIEIPGLALSPLDGNLSLLSSGEIGTVELNNAERTLTLRLTPQDNDWLVSVEANNWQPQDTSLQFNDLTVQGKVSGSQARFDHIEGHLYGGKIIAKGTLDWSSRPSASGSFVLQDINLPQALAGFGSKASIDGNMEASGTFTSRAGTAGQLIANAGISAAFSATDGSINQVDLASSMLPASRDHNTRFDKLSGSLEFGNGAYHYRKLALDTAQFHARGSLDIQADQRISGSVSAELATPSRRMQTSFGLSGSTGDVRIR